MDLIGDKKPSQLSTGAIREALSSVGISTRYDAPRDVLEVQLQTLLDLLPGQEEERIGASAPGRSDSEDSNASFGSPRNLRSPANDSPVAKGAYAVQEFDEGLYFQLDVPVCDSFCVAESWSATSKLCLPLLFV